MKELELQFPGSQLLNSQIDFILTFLIKFYIKTSYRRGGNHETFNEESVWSEGSF